MYFLIYLLSVCAVSVLFCVIAIKKNAPCFAGLSKKEHPLRFFYPAGYVLYILVTKYLFVGKDWQEKKAQLRTLYPDGDVEQLFLIYQTKKFTLAFVLVVLFHFLALCYVGANQGNRQLDEQYRVERDTYGGQDKTVVLDVVGNDKKELVKQEIELEVGALEYTQDQIKKDCSAESTNVVSINYSL